MTKLIPVVLCGGSGTRMWPLSRSNYPKQFLNIMDEGKSTFQSTLLRMPSQSEEPILVCNEQHRFILAEQVSKVSKQAQNIILEPECKNTAAAITLAALTASQNGEDPILLVTPADHLIRYEHAFHQTVQKGMKLAEENKLVTLGVKPEHPETGYGYIQQGSEISSGCHQVNFFTEKPDYDTALDFIEQGNFLWNSGMFLFKASVILKEMAKYSPDIVDCCASALLSQQDESIFTRLDHDIFSRCPSDSIDYAVMEKTDGAVVVSMNTGWSDIGSWSSVWELMDKDLDGNGKQGDVICQKSHNNFVHSSNRLVSLVGMDDVVVVETADAVLVAKKSEVQDIKGLVSELKDKHRKEGETHRKVVRPWGNFDSIDNGNRFQVKHITVDPGKKLSTQKHHHRAEHWIVVSGAAKVTINEDTWFLAENQSAYIPTGAVHCLENPGSIPLELIEVQSGEYLGEDDIVRLADDYGRVENG
jgi:mannose-1-phosphate guanylyltransferase